MIEVLSVIDQTCWLVGVVTPIRAVLGGSSVLPVIRLFLICFFYQTTLKLEHVPLTLSNRNPNVEVAACCGSYEDCISCCLRPEQRPGLQQILNKAAESNNVLFVRWLFRTKSKCGLNITTLFSV